MAGNFGRGGNRKQTREQQEALAALGFVQGAVVDAGAETSLTFMANVADLVPDPTQPRKNFDQKRILEKAESMNPDNPNGVGTLDALIVGPEYFDKKLGRKVRPIIDGEMRWRAAPHAGLSQLPVTERIADPKTRLLIQLAANLLRDNLSPEEIANATDRLILEHGMSLRAIAKAVGHDASTVSRARRVYEDEVLKAAVESEEITYAQAAEMVAADKAQRPKLVQETAKANKKKKEGGGKKGATSKSVRNLLGIRPHRKGAAGKVEAVAATSGPGTPARRPEPAIAGGLAKKSVFDFLEAVRSKGELTEAERGDVLNFVAGIDRYCELIRKKAGNTNST